MEIKVKIEDMFGLHKGFMLTLKNGCTALVGPNGAGKTTLLKQLKEYGEKNGFKVISYSNLKDGGSSARERYLFQGKLDMLGASMIHSEGENVINNFGDALSNIGMNVRKCKNTKDKLMILLDGIDSGLSIDKVHEIREVLDIISNDIANNDIYLVMAVNQYEMIRELNGSIIDCVNVRTGKHRTFRGYNDYSKFICGFKEKYPNLGENKN